MAVKPTKDLIRGSSDPSTVQTYKTKKDSHSGVTGSRPVTRLMENGAKGITPDVMKMGGPGVNERVVKDKVRGKERGPGMANDAGKVKK